MDKIVNRLESLLESVQNYFSNTSGSEVSEKPNPEKWSKKEILGHLIDSGINNLQRFTEIQFKNKPYKIAKYDQNELVKANDYQNSEITEMVSFWTSVNKRIRTLIEKQTEESLNFEVELTNGRTSDLRFLIIDYVDHLEHHMNQIERQ